MATDRHIELLLKKRSAALPNGVLNDCFFNAATAVCVKRAKTVGRPLPLHNMLTRDFAARRCCCQRIDCERPMKLGQGLAERGHPTKPRR
jgi:hypothetical protein